MVTGTQPVPSYAHGASAVPLLGETRKIQKHKLRERGIETLGLQAAAGLRTA